MASFKFQCPECGRSFKSNKDLGGRLKRCGQCRGTFTIRRTAPVKAGAPAKPDPIVLHDPELAIDQVFTALQDYRKTSPSLPKDFAAEATFGSFEPVHRVTLEATFEGGKRESARRETLSYPPALAEIAQKGGRRVVDLRFDHTSQLAGLLADKPAPVREAAERLAKELRPPAGAKFSGRRLIIDHLQLWGTQWGWHGAEGEAWFYGKPLRVYLPKPPKRSGAPAVLATLAALAGLAAVGYVLWEYDLIRPGERRAAAPPAPAPAAPVKPAALTFARDGLLQMDDGSFLRGSLERKGADVVVKKDADTVAVPPWKIESLHVEASVFLRGEARRLDELETKVKGAKSASREELVGLFLEIHRQSDRWVPLTALCSATELPREPQKRLEDMRVDVGKLLEAPQFAANPTASPDPAVKAPPPNPALGVAAGLLAQLRTTPDRPALAASLQALRGEKLPQYELIEIAAAWLSRSEVESGLATDRVHVKTGAYEGSFDGALEKRTDGFAKLRLPAGTDLTVYKEKSAWTAILPGGLTMQDAQVTVTPAARTASGERMKASLDRLPPERWIAATSTEHLKTAKAVDLKGAKDRGQPVLRLLAAGHAATALRTGSPQEIVEARVFLHELGYTQGADGRWERPEDRRAAQMGRLLADGKADEARLLLPGGPAAAGDFPAAYRAAALNLLSPIRSVDELTRSVGVLDQALAIARTPGESKHVLALKASVSGYGICPSCGSNPAKVCATCRGKGTRTEACVRCHGLGYIATVGIGATGSKTCESCQGKPIRGTRPCEHCAGTGKRSCAKCQGQTKLPAPADLARTRPCAGCAGAGTRGEGIVHGCASCAGLGVQLVPTNAPEATIP